MGNDRKLTSLARQAIEQDELPVFSSAVNAFEISLKYGLGKLAIAADLISDYEVNIRKAGLIELAISNRHALGVSKIDFAHNDPFDLLLISQALCEDLTLISNEKRFDESGVVRLWN